MICFSRLLRALGALCLPLLLVTRLGAADSPAPADQIRFEFALYFAPKPAADPEAALTRLVAQKERRLQLAGSPVAGALATVTPRWVPLGDYAPPAPDSFKYFADGLTEEDRVRMAEAERVFIVEFATSRQGALITNRAACALFGELAEATAGHIWDEETRQVFSREKWRARRIETWQGNLPDLRGHVTLHAYQDPTLLRVITLGLRKFGLPDLVMQDLPRNGSRSAANFINAFMQRSLEGEKTSGGKLALNLHEIRHATARQSALTNPREGATAKVVVSVALAPREDGDPKNTLWLLDFPEAKFKTAAERSEWAMAKLFGSSDTITGVAADDPEMAAARKKARQAFFVLESRFRKGLEVNEHLLIKAPFRAAGHTEYMWVEVNRWSETEIEGLLASDPHYIKSLRAGSPVKVPLPEIYDYILQKPDGTTEGNETGKVLERRGR